MIPCPRIFLSLVWKQEVFFILIDKAATEGFLFGFKLVNKSGEVMRITHLLFADDTLVFYRDSKEQMTHMSWILLWFKAFSDLNIDLEKSSIMPMGSVEDIEGLALEPGYNIGTLPTSYLGLPLGVHRNSTFV